MSDVYELFKEHIEMPDDFTKAIWTEERRTVSWNTESSREDLYYGDNETYSGEIREEGIVIGNYVMFRLDSSCGYEYQAIFCLDNKLTYAELEAEIEDV